MSATRNCLAMTLGTIAVALLLVGLGVPGAVIFALTPVALCLSMVLLMTRHSDVDAGLRLHEASLDASRKTGDDTPGEYQRSSFGTAR